MTILKIRITALEETRRRYAVKFMGKKVAVAFDRDSGAKVAYGADMISGEIDSGGSRKNWFCTIAEGSVFELEVDELTYIRNRNRVKKWAMEVIEYFSDDEKHERDKQRQRRIDQHNLMHRQLQEKLRSTL
jgi:hypothetical protein